MLDELRQDLWISLRGLRRAPMVVMTIITTVGLGIGATTVILSAVNAALLRPLPYAEPDQLVRIYTDAPPNKFPFSVADYLALQAQQTQFEQIAGYTSREMAFTDGASAERVRGRLVSWTYFSLLGLRPAIGRDFTEADGRPGGPQAVIVSHGFWQQRLGGRAEAVGKAIRLDGSDYMVAGVLPRTTGPLEQQREFFAAAQWQTPPRKGPFFITAIGRLGGSAARSTAAEELGAINRRIFPLWKASYQDEKATWGLMDLKAHVVGDVRSIAGLALAAVALVWLIACANASNLLISRVTSRRRELAVRTALGASRGRLLRHLLAESLLLAIGAAGFGMALAWAGVGLLRGVGSSYFPRTDEITMDGPVLWLLAGVTVASVLLFGLIPAVHGTGGPVSESLHTMGRSLTASVGARRLRRVLVGSQFAIATPLLIVAALLLTSLNRLGRVDLGFDSHNLLSASIALPTAQYAEPARVAAFWDELQRRIEASPGVSKIAFADGRPPNEVGNFNNFDLEAFPTASGGIQPVAPWISVTPEYFDLLDLTLLEGRLFEAHDGLRPFTEVVVVDRAWAKRFFPNDTAVGKRLKEGGCTRCPWTTVVGVVSEVKYAGLDKPDQGSVYAPMAARGTVPVEEATSRFRYLVVRTGTDPLAIVPAVRRILRELDPSLPLSNVATIEELVERSLQRPRSLSLLVGGFAFVALVLSIIGIYGVMAYYVQQHAKDISVRLALGGTPGAVLRMIVGQGMTIVSSGMLVGLMAAIGLTRLMTTLLFGVSALDAFTFTAVGILMLSVALVACFVPARRATGIEVATVLRSE